MSDYEESREKAVSEVIALMKFPVSKERLRKALRLAYAMGSEQGINDCIAAKKQAYEAVYGTQAS